MLAAAVDWTMILSSLILALPAIIAAVYAGRVHHQVQTPSGQKIGVVSEYAHDTAIANNMLLSKANGATKPADRETIHEEGSTPPQIPVQPLEEG